MKSEKQTRGAAPCVRRDIITDVSAAPSAIFVPVSSERGLFGIIFVDSSRR
jgi:hypothetical protein